MRLPQMVNLAVLMKKAAKKLLFQNPNSLYRPAELKDLIERMDRGDFTFSPQEQKKMIEQWKFCVTECPLPTKIKDIYYKHANAVTMNSLEVADANFKLPYGIAFEETNQIEYQRLVDYALKGRIPCDNKVVLDAGCGFGGMLSCIKKNYPSATCMGIECVASAKELLNKFRPWIQTFVCNIEGSTADFQKEFPLKADVILSTAVLEHLHHPEQAVKNLLSIMAKGGALVLVVPNGRIDQSGHHIHFWSPESWKLFVHKSAPGYRIEFPLLREDASSIGYDLCAIVQDPC